MGYYELQFDKDSNLWLAYDAYALNDDWCVICTHATRDGCIDKAESKGWRWAGE